jgi:hypothetical protein
LPNSIPMRVAIAQNASPINEWQAVEQALGRAGQGQSDGAYKVNMPRGDMNVTVAGTSVKPALALGCGGIQQARCRSNDDG